ncbi:MAG: PHP domain-containing protein [Spirochaetaceae bacterium]|nr:MAG: PHP domain-containing protein [Spirochaetaceae bacterium]
MQTKSAFRDEGRWYKGNTHAHTNLSDGVLSPQQLVELYRTLGYDFCAITDHRIYGVHAELSSAGFLVLPGVELDVGVEGGAALCHHVVGLAIPGRNSCVHGQRFEYEQHAGVQQIISLLQQRGNLCIYAHPSWSHVEHQLIDELDGIAALEIYNHECEVCAVSGYAESHYDRLLWRGRRAWCIASDDSHQHQPDYGGGFLMVKAAELTQAAIIDALLEGSFYASQGPQIHSFRVENNSALLSCSPCRTIGFLSDSRPGRAITREQAEVSRASYPIDGSETYVRAVCIDHSGRRAWTQPIWLD